MSELHPDNIKCRLRPQPLRRVLKHREVLRTPRQVAHGPHFVTLPQSFISNLTDLCLQAGVTSAHPPDATVYFRGADLRASPEHTALPYNALPLAVHRTCSLLCEILSLLVTGGLSEEALPAVPGHQAQGRHADEEGWQQRVGTPGAACRPLKSRWTPRSVRAQQPDQPVFSFLKKHSFFFFLSNPCTHKEL